MTDKAARMAASQLERMSYEKMVEWLKTLPRHEIERLLRESA